MKRQILKLTVSLQLTTAEFKALTHFLTLRRQPRIDGHLTIDGDTVQLAIPAIDWQTLASALGPAVLPRLLANVDHPLIHAFRKIRAICDRKPVRPTPAPPLRLFTPERSLT